MEKLLKLRPQINRKFQRVLVQIGTQTWDVEALAERLHLTVIEMGDIRFNEWSELGIGHAPKPRAWVYSLRIAPLALSSSVGASTPNKRRCKSTANRCLETDSSVGSGGLVHGMRLEEGILLNYG